MCAYFGALAQHFWYATASTNGLGVQTQRLSLFLREIILSIFIRNQNSVRIVCQFY